MFFNYYGGLEYVEEEEEKNESKAVCKNLSDYGRRGVHCGFSRTICCHLFFES
jgi:hypothetical protein